MIDNVLYLDKQSVGPQIETASVCRDRTQPSEYEAPEGLIVVHGESYVKRMLHILKLGISADSPESVSEIADLRIPVFFVHADIADKLFNQILHRDDPHRAAVFVEDYREALAILLHVLEQNIRLLIFGDEIRGFDGVLHDVFPAFILQSEIVLRVEHSDHIVNRIIADRVIGMKGSENQLLPVLFRLVRPQNIGVRPVCRDLSGRHIVEFEDVLDKRLFSLVDHTLFAPDVDKHSDILFADLLVLRVRVDPEHPENSVCR